MQAALVLFLLIALAMDLGLLVFAITRQDRSRSIYFAALITVLFLYTLGYLLEIMCNTPDGAMTALRLENAGIPLIAPFFLLTCLSIFQWRLVRPWMLPAALAYGAVMFCIVLFNDYHHLYYTSVGMIYAAGESFIKLGRGPLYVVQQTVSMLLMFITYALLFTRFLQGGNKLRRQMKFIIAGSMLGFAANILNFIGVLPPGLDPTPFAMTLGLLLFAYDMFVYKLLDIVAFASNTAVATMDDAVIALDNDWGFLFANRSAKRLFPKLAYFLGTEDVSGMPGWPAELAPPIAVGQQVAFRRQNEVNGKKSTYRANVSRISDPQGRPIGWSLVIRDISDITELMNRLEGLATVDPLTGIYNRRQFFTMVEREFKINERLGMGQSLIMYDLDHFKDINDKYGHMAGDYVLCAVVDIIKKQLRTYDIFARYGGEEFVIFITSSGGGRPEDFAERLCRAIAEADIVYEGTHIPVTASFGAVAIPRGVGFDAIMRAADDAMYQAKARGRNCVAMGTVEMQN